MEFWNENIIDRSWKLLHDLKQDMEFILIGGWAVYFLTKTIKSKDLDIIINFDVLSRLKEFGIRKNDKLKKYEIELEGIDVDIYVPYYSKLVLPVEEIMKKTVSIDGFKIPRPEILLILKQQAEIARRNVVKGQKDRTDIISLLMKDLVDFEYYKNLLKKFNIENYLTHLKKIIKEADKEFAYLGIANPGEIKRIKNKLLSKLKI